MIGVSFFSLDLEIYIGKLKIKAKERNAGDDLKHRLVGNFLFLPNLL